MLYRCYAKLNLTLEVLGRRDDGFHQLASLVHTINLADDLRIEAADQLRTRVEGLLEDLEPEANLVARAAALLANETAQKRGAELSLIKRIPAAAGLGGGSSNAATTLVGVNALWNTRLGLTALAQLAAELGSDVPFFVRGGAALMSGRGDELETLPPLKGQWLVLVVPAHTLSDKTRRLYGALRPGDFSSGSATRSAAERLRQGLPLRESDLGNVFERAAREVFPGLSEVWAAAERRAQRRFCLSGAGPALFALAADHADARRQVSQLQLDNLQAFATRTVKHARASVRFAAGSAIGYS